MYDEFTAESTDVKSMLTSMEKMAEEKKLLMLRTAMYQPRHKMQWALRKKFEENSSGLPCSCGAQSELLIFPRIAHSRNVETYTTLSKHIPLAPRFWSLSTSHSTTTRINISVNCYHHSPMCIFTVEVATNVEREWGRVAPKDVVAETKVGHLGIGSGDDHSVRLQR